MIKNATIFRIAKGCHPSTEAVQAALEKAVFTPCGATQEKSIGFIPPRGKDHGALIESVAGQWILRLKLETKSVPAAVLATKVDEKAALVERETGRKPGKKERKELKDEARLELLPHAFPKQSTITVWIERLAGLMVIDTTNNSRLDDTLFAIVGVLPHFAVAPLQTITSPESAMAHWLVDQEPPENFSIDRECELKANDESKAVVKYGRHPLDISEIQEHIKQGKLPTKLALTWDDRVSFVLTDALQLRKLAFLDAVFEGEQLEDKFDADVVIATGELSKLIRDLIAALGGEPEPQGAF